MAGFTQELKQKNEMTFLPIFKIQYRRGRMFFLRFRFKIDPLKHHVNRFY